MSNLSAGQQIATKSTAMTIGNKLNSTFVEYEVVASRCNPKTITNDTQKAIEICFSNIFVIILSPFP